MDGEEDQAGKGSVPWWVWGFVVAVVPALLSLMTPWFRTVPPRGIWLSPHSYGAWAHARLGMIGPFFLVWVGGQWFCALRGWWGPPSPRDWRGAGRWMEHYATGAPTRGNGGRRTSPPRPAPRRPYQAGAAISLVEGVAVLGLLGINRALVHDGYSIIDVTHGGFTHGSFSVHPAFGFWCVLTACGLFVVSGLIGCIPYLFDS